MTYNRALIEQIRVSASTFHPSVHPPASFQTLRAAEANLGFTLPHLLQSLYLQVGNGFRNSSGGRLLGLEGGWTPNGDTLDSMYRGMHDPDGLDEDLYSFNGRVWTAMPDRLIHVFAWPCVRYTCLDCSRTETPVYIIDGNFLDASKPDRPLPVIKHKNTFEEWLQDWADGVDLEEQMEALIDAYTF